MSSLPVWDRGWVNDQTSAIAMDLFRLVETQHIAATMRLVDSADEQDLLEQMLEESKPPMPDATAGVHYLLAAPFRYFPQTGSRFRAVNTPGVWYGGDDPYCACSEMAYWRQRFFLDSAGLHQLELSTEHSMYQARVNGIAVDLLLQPWAQAEELWMHPSSYQDTQELGQLVRQSGQVAWIRYKSVRASGHTCGAVFDPKTLRMITPDMQYEQWYCHVNKDRVTFSNGRKRFDF
ncbi:MAG: RES family NAD+ phosphorylase [Burkholderiaceae bacterium]